MREWDSFLSGISFRSHESSTGTSLWIMMNEYSKDHSKTSIFHFDLEKFVMNYNLTVTVLHLLNYFSNKLSSMLKMKLPGGWKLNTWKNFYFNWNLKIFFFSYILKFGTNKAPHPHYYYLKFFPLPFTVYLADFKFVWSKLSFKIISADKLIIRFVSWVTHHAKCSNR